jgi:hypothetical protein
MLEASYFSNIKEANRISISHIQNMLLDLSMYLTRVVLTLFIIFGTIGNALNIFIFTRPALLRASCTLYLLAGSIDNILVIYTSLLTRLLANGFSTDITITSNVMCKTRYYFGYVFLALSPYFFILACFDRYCSSSSSSARRAWCNKKLAKRLIIGAIILACILYSHMAIFFELKTSEAQVICYTQPGIYDTFYRIFYLVVYCILPSVFMGLLCVKALFNVRIQAHRIKPMLATGNETLRRIDRRVIRVLFVQILTQVLCILPFAIINLLALFIDTTTVLYIFLNRLFVLPLFVSYATSFYFFTLSSRVYRQELLKLVWFWKRKQIQNEKTIGTVVASTKIRQQQKIVAMNH